MEQGSNTGSRGGMQALTAAYQPIIRGYFGVAGSYYAVMTPIHWLATVQSGGEMLAAISGSTCLVCACFWRLLRQPVSTRKLEAWTGVINLLLVLNVVMAIRVEYDQAKLVYFMMLATIFGFASITLRQALLSIAIALASMFAMLAAYAPQQLIIYGYVTFAAAVCTLAITVFLKRAITVALDQRQLAEIAQSEAERRLVASQELGEQMRLQSLSDSLTGLPNRRAFFEQLRACNGSQSEARAWLVLLDLDGFKAVNDNYGHIVGDELLKAVSGRLLEHCGDEAFACRMGGDEFNMILPGDATEEAVAQWSEDLLRSLANVYLIEDRLIRISGSIGCCPVTGEEADSKLLQKADYALIQAKRNGKNRVIVFCEAHVEDAERRFAIEQALRGAVFPSEIELVYQPQVAIADQSVVGVEALARWNSPTIGVVPPDQFIHIAEETGLIAKVTLAVLDKLIAELAQCRQRLPASINLSGHDLMSDEVIDEILDRVAASDVDPALIEFEVTETAMMPDMGRARSNLLRLSRHGHPISLDDFGTGYSNFTYLRTLPIGKLKIDRSFIDDLGNPATEKVLHALVGFARSLGVQHLFEGIETQLDLIVARRVGCQVAQGFLFGRPMTIGELRAYLAASPAARMAEGGDPADLSRYASGL